jgi:hypothetical protein
VENPCTRRETRTRTKESQATVEPTKGQNHETDPIAQQNEDKPEDGGDTLMQLDDQDLVDIDLEKLEEAFNKKELQTIPVEQLKKVHKVFIDSTAGATSRLGISSDPASELRCTSHERKCEATNQHINSSKR